MENLNSVCYVASISEIKPIEGADNIEQAIIGGWNCIVKKGEYQVDQLVVVATTDAVIPQELSDAMNVTNYLRKGQRVKTVKLRGVYSECLIIPMEFAKKTTGYANTKWNDGDDMMDTLKIFKYEPPVKQIQLASGKKIRYQDNFNFHVYYKFPNLKNVSGLFTEEDEVEITRKIHGTNARYGIVKKIKLSFWDKCKKFLRLADECIDYEFVVGSHNVEKGSDSQGYYDTNVWYEVAEKYNIREKLWDLFKLSKDLYQIEQGIIIYGEIYGPGIQKNYDYGLSEIQYAGFDVTINGQYCETARSFTIHNILNLDYVPTLYYGLWSQEVQDKFTFNNFIDVVEVNITDIKSNGEVSGIKKTTKVPHEGIVIKALDGNRHKVAKVINPDYLIYSEKHDVGDSH